MTRVFRLYGCAPCHTRWWTVDPEPNPGHDCPKGYPAGGMLVERVVVPPRRRPKRVAA